MNIETYEFDNRQYVGRIDGMPVLESVRADKYPNLREFVPADSLPSGMRKMKRGNCYHNALSTWSRYGLRYAEGYVLTDYDIWIAHAWNLDDEDRVIDRTLKGVRYVGVSV